MNEIDFIRLYTESPSVIFDVGCYDCRDSFLLKREWPECRVVAFEASPKVFSEIPDHYSEVVEAYNLAIADTDGTCSFFSIDDKRIHGKSGMSGSILAPTDKLCEDSPNLKPAGVMATECRRIDSICKELNIKHVDYMRIDVQGAETLVLAGFGEVRPSLLRLEENECSEAGHYAGAGSLAQLKELLSSMGYDRLWGDGYNAHYVHSSINPK